ncbi:LPS O-antigen length regulator, partial [Vibrio parahaemolyticus]
MEPQKEPNPNYLPYPPQPQSTDDEIDLRELFKALWKGKWIIIAT